MSEVYFIRPKGERGPVKIGCGRSARDRIQYHRCKLPFDIEVCATLDGGYDLERRFHALFQSDHIGGEWFKWSADLEQVISSVADGSLAVEALPEPKVLRARRGSKPLPPYLATTHADGVTTYVKLRAVELPYLASAA